MTMTSLATTESITEIPPSSSAMTTNVDVSETGVVESTTLAATEMPANAALIGGVLGGVVALLLVVGVIASIVMRVKQKQDVGERAMQATHSPASNYGYFNITQYDDTRAVRTTQNVYEGVHDKLGD